MDLVHEKAGRMNIKGKIIQFFFGCNSIKNYWLNPEEFLLSSPIKCFQSCGSILAERGKRKRLHIINTTSKQLVTIILPMFNSEKTIINTLKSIQEQSFQHWELLLIDDGSADASLEMIRSYAQLDSRIKVYQNLKNKGVAYSRNVGLYHAKGDFITFHDADDTSHQDRMEYQLAALLSRSKTTIAITQYVRLNSEGSVLFINGATKRNHVSGMMFRKNVITKIGYFKSLRISEDSEYHERILATFGKKSRKVICKTLYYALLNSESLLFSNAKVSINKTSLNYKINNKDFSELETCRLEHKRIKAGKLSPYCDFCPDNINTIRLLNGL
jgi:glycosyltransferase involved in cell wall biosynthesis